MQHKVVSVMGTRVRAASTGSFVGGLDEAVASEAPRARRLAAPTDAPGTRIDGSSRAVDQFIGGAVVVAAHGGSGASTVARALRLPEAPAPTGAGVLVVTARTTADGAARVIGLVGVLPGGQPVLLALTADGPLRPPAAINGMRRLLTDRLAGVVVLPWQARWRHERASAQTADRAWTARAMELDQLVGRLTRPRLAAGGPSVRPLQGARA